MSAATLGCNGELKAIDHAASEPDAVYALNDAGSDASSPLDTERDASPDAERDASEEPEPYDGPSSPLARLSNDEIVASLAFLFSLPEDAPALEQARGSLVAEANVLGLANDSSTQQLTHIGVSGYWNLAQVTAKAFLADITTLDELDLLMECELRELERGLSDEQEYTRPMCFDDYTRGLASRAFRRPLDDDDDQNIERLLERLRAVLVTYDRDPDDLAAYAFYIENLTRFVTLSPHFILMVEKGQPQGPDELLSPRPLTEDEIATRMALFLTGSLPDEALIADARAGRLSDPSGRIANAERILAQESGRRQLVKTLVDWFELNPSLLNDEDIVTFTAFLEDWYSNEREFSELYEAPVRVEHIDGTQKLEPYGILGLRAYVMSHTNDPTPAFITRGVFLVERQLCAILPEGIPVDALDVAEQTDVEVFKIHAQDECASCHRVFDNYGAAFQRFDGATSIYDPMDTELGESFELGRIGDIEGTVADTGDLSATIAHSNHAADCMAELWFRKAVRRNMDAQGRDRETMNEITALWRMSGDSSLKSLLRTIVGHTSFVTLYPDANTP